MSLKNTPCNTTTIPCNTQTRGCHPPLCNPYEWPSLQNMGVAFGQAVYEQRDAWLKRLTSGDSWCVYEKMDGTNLAVSSRKGTLFGRHYTIDDAADRYQGTSLAKVRSHGERGDVRKISDAIVGLMPQSVQCVCEDVIVYGELIVKEKHGYYARTPSKVKAGDWFVFGAAIVLSTECQEDEYERVRRDIKRCLNDKDVVVMRNDKDCGDIDSTDGGRMIFIACSPGFEGLVRGATQSRVDFVPRIGVAQTIIEAVKLADAFICGDEKAASMDRTEGVIIVGWDGPPDYFTTAKVLKLKSGFADESQSKNKLARAIEESATNNDDDDETLSILHKIASLSLVPSNQNIKRIKDGKLSFAGPKNEAGSPLHVALDKLIDSALTKIESLSVIREKGGLAEAVEFVLREVLEDAKDIVSTMSTNDKVPEAVARKQLERNVRWLVGRRVAATIKT